MMLGGGLLGTILLIAIIVYFVRRTGIGFSRKAIRLTPKVPALKADVLGSVEARKIISITNVIGWLSTVILLATICRQVYSQWKSKATSGVSRWLFVGQISASIGFVCYSYQLQNWIFLFSNSAMLMTAILGEMVYVSNRRRCQQSPDHAMRTN